MASSCKQYASPRWSGEIPDCSMPMTFDQHSNCSFGCLYCFSAYQRGIGAAAEDYLHNRVRPVSVARVKRIFTEPDKYEFGEYVKDRKVMQWGGLSDPFCMFERELGTGLELLRFFKEQEYPLCFSTKSVWWLDDPRYTELFRGQKNWNVKISIITLDEEKAAVIERQVPSPEQRIEALGKIAQLDCGGATLRLRPFMLGITDPHHTELIARAAGAGATAVSTEFFCLEIRSPQLREHLRIFSRLAGFNYLGFYKKASYAGGYLRLNRNVKRRYVDEMEEACAKHGVRFYVSDAHFKERSANGSCCGLDETWNYSRGQFTEALLLCKRNGRVTWSEVAEHLSYADGILAHSAAGCQLAAGSSHKRAQFPDHSITDVLRWLWNNPKAGQSPYTMFEGVMEPAELDAQGDVVYKYNKRRE